VNHVTKVFFTHSLKFIAFWVAVGGLGVVIALLAIRLIQEIHDIYINWPHYNALLERFFTHWLAKMEIYYLKLPGTNNPKEWREHMSELGRDFSRGLQVLSERNLLSF